ncbi:probable extended synaptotagmin-3 [Coccomyxa sp. Obi]|nr:probable extended synaptotagmin-3 [Coccomyxa sp. Obi]
MEFTMDDFLLGFLICALLSVAALSLYVKHKKREAERERQIMAVEILRNLNVAKLRKLLGNMELPSWITYSDFERAEWLSHLLGQIWPYLDNAVSAVGRAKLEPKLRERRAA